MLEIVRENGEIKAVLEWWTVNADGTFNDKGLYCWLAEVEISKSYRNNGTIGILKNFYKEIIKKAPQVKCAYYQRLNRKNKKIKLFGRMYWDRLFQEEK